MDIATIIGAILAICALGMGIGSNLKSMLHLQSLAIVMVGTLGALFVSFPLPELIKAPFGIGLRYAFFTPKAVIHRISESLGSGEKEQISPGDLKKLKKELELGILMYSRMKTYAQATGWIGVFVGLVIMLENGLFTNPSQFGPGMAICILTAFYGIVIAYIICLPIQTKLERHLSLIQDS